MHPHTITSHTFALSLRHRYGISHPDTTVPSCQCIATSRLLFNHPFTCMTTRQKPAITRHNLVRDTLVSLIHQHLHLTCLKEKLSPTISHPQFRPDILVLTPDGTIVIDVSIVCPTATSHLNISSLHPLGAAAYEENNKVSYYNEHQHLHPHSTFYPFVCESTGAIGHSAMRLLTVLAQYAPSPPIFIRSATSAISATIQTSNAHYLSQYHHFASHFTSLQSWHPHLDILILKFYY